MLPWLLGWNQGPTFSQRVGQAATETRDAIQPYTAPVVAAAYAGVQRVGTWIQPIPAATTADQIAWNRQETYKPFTENVAMELFAIFEDQDKRRALTEKHIFCAMHHPGVGLDLIVLFDLSSEYDANIIDLYADWRGGARDRLLETAKSALARHIYPYPGKSYEQLLREKITDSRSLLRRVLDDHRYIVSPQAFIGRPDTLSALNTLLRERQSIRIRSNHSSRR